MRAEPELARKALRSFNTPNHNLTYIYLGLGLHMVIQTTAYLR
jgi:hypothetical protein